MNDGKLDLGPLDPARTASRWEQMIEQTTARALAAASSSSGAVVPLRKSTHEAPASVFEQLLVWWRPALAVAAAFALVATGGGWLLPRSNGAVVYDPATALAGWEASDELPSTADILGTLGADDDYR